MQETSEHLSVECEEALSNSLRISNVAWGDLLEWERGVSISNLISDFTTSDWNGPSDSILSVFDIASNVVSGQHLLVRPPALSNQANQVTFLRVADCGLKHFYLEIIFLN